MLINPQDLDTRLMAEGAIMALTDAGFAIIEVGSIPPWMERVADLPVGTVYRVTDSPSYDWTNRA